MAASKYCEYWSLEVALGSEEIKSSKEVLLINTPAAPLRSTHPYLLSAIYPSYSPTSKSSSSSKWRQEHN